MGYRIGGPAAYGFARWIEKKAFSYQVKKLFFVARDGYTLHKVFETFDNPHIKSTYIYALRFLNNICCLDYQPTSRSQMQTILKYFAKKSPALQNIISTDKLTKEQLRDCIQKNLATLTPLAQQELKHYRAYLSAYYKPGQLIGVVDSVTAFFSSQKLIEIAMGNQNVIGYYWAVQKSNIDAKYRFESFLPRPTGHDNYKIFTHCWPFMEFLFTAPEPPIKNISLQGEPLYDAYIPLEEKVRVTSYKKLSSGMLDFAKDIKRIFGGRDIFLTPEFLCRWINWFLLHPSQTDKQEMAKIFHASGSDHQEYEPLLSFRPSLRQIFSSLKHYVSFSKQAYWKTPFQFCLTCLLSPAALERPARYQQIVYFFPRLRKQYFRKSIHIGRNTFIVIWGRRND